MSYFFVLFFLLYSDKQCSCSACRGMATAPRWLRLDPSSPSPTLSSRSPAFCPGSCHQQMDGRSQLYRKFAQSPEQSEKQMLLL